MKNTAFRESLINQADSAYIELASQLNTLFDLAGFFLDRYPEDTRSNIMKCKELKTTVDNIADLLVQLAATLRTWKTGGERVLSRSGTEVTVIGELWVNAQALLYFLSSHDISLDGFDAHKAAYAYHSLIHINRLLT